MLAARFALHNLSKQFNNLIITELTHCVPKTFVKNSNCIHHITNSLPLTTTWRASHTFLSRLTAEQLWKGVTSVSNAGRKKGRGKASGRTKARDLNRGQVIGFGKKNMLWPGLNSPVIQGREVLRQQELPPDESREKRLLELRDKLVSNKRFKLHPLDRGWAGNRLGGRSLGPPEVEGEPDAFEGFDSRIIEFKTVMHVTATRGKVRRLSALAVVGNKKGLVGYAKATSPNGMTAAKSARNRAGRNLRYIELDGSTVLHDFASEYGAVKIFVRKKPEGYGLVCHRVLRAICQMVGIKDMHAKVEGPTGNYQHVTRAFFIGLMTQKSPQQLADEKGLHLIEMRADCNYFPRIVASPAKCRTQEEIGLTEQLDYRLHVLDGKVEAPRKKFQPFFVNFPSYIKEMKDRAFQRNQRKVRLNLICKYGQIKSFLTLQEEEKQKKELRDNVEKE